MHDLKAIRENPEAFDAALARRKLAPLSPRILALDAERRGLQTKLQEMQARRNEASKQIGELKRTGSSAEALVAEVAKLKEETPLLEVREAELASELNDILSATPNLPAVDVPNGNDEHDNVELRRHGTPGTGNSNKQHFELGEALGLMDFATAAKLSGARFTLLRGELARLERALGQFMLDLHTREHGYTEMSPPLLVRGNIIDGVTSLKKFEEDLFKSATTDHYLIATSEVPLTNIVNNEIVPAEELPYRFTAMTPCFRSEAGAAGKDTRGMIRQHQFYKVEMVSITAPEQSEAEHQRMTECAETALKKLELPFRTIVLCTGDMGFAAQKTYDIEVWLPGQGTYREISSCSNCGDFQARRMNARMKAGGDKATRFVHTLNGSGVAVGRALIAVMENYQQADGSIAIPAVLQPYMGGQKVIEMKRLRAA